jgi:disulfide bond formation protein DsbB
VNAADVIGWAGAGVVLVATVLLGAGARIAGRVLMIAAMVVVVVALAMSGESWWWFIPPGLILGWHGCELGSDLRKKAAK